MTSTSIVLQPRKKSEKVRWGIYIDREVHDVVMDIAERSGMSYNETLVELVKAGIKAYQE